MLMSVTTRPRASLGRVIEDLGNTLLEVVSGAADDDAEIETVVIHDVLDDAMPMRGALVLGVGLSDPEEIAALLQTLAAQHASALVLRAPVRAEQPVRDASEATGIPVLALTRGASWAQLAAMLRSLIAEGDVGDQGATTLGGMPSGDLFALANAIATLLNAPVTIEDRNSRVVAFSGRQHEADPARIETVLGRQVPERFARQLEERGVFQELYRSEDPIDVGPVLNTEGLPSFPRVALAVRAGDEILGSIWAAVQEPLSPDRVRALKDSAGLVALHMLRLRAGADVERRLRADLLATILEGGPGAADATARLRLNDHRCVVLALSAAEEADDEPSAGARGVAERQHIADAFAVHLGAVYLRSAVAVIGDVVYAVVGTRPEQGDAESGAERSDADNRAARVATDFLGRLGATSEIRIGVGTVADETTGIPSSRANADRALRVVRQAPSHEPVARFTAVQMEALLVELGDLVRARGDQPTGPVAQLLAQDREKGTHLVETLRAWLDAFGDVAVAAARVYTHPNTFRYRLRRLSEISGLDLTDPEARFSAMVQLHLLVPRD
ncbi:MAG: helix-turn-helix domain-containing protein [Microbacterium sp.]|nr:helix-turn-helix domain-containing protein [Microbacterium sp.]MCV0390006.1 helix-turn-helix domain-containing protein [Microbacterium sp.]MCV0419541.1 helix-turn-helix domain-containing protein [Microbacterium sp.]MCV0421846.1 helix-turn-helix domain-containing protein [Microbacterium sp.]